MSITLTPDQRVTWARRWFDHLESRGIALGSVTSDDLTLARHDQDSGVMPEESADSLVKRRGCEHVAQVAARVGDLLAWQCRDCGNIERTDVSLV